MVVVVVVQIRPDEPANIPSLFALEVSHTSLQRVCANDDAPENISSMFVTLDTSHLDISPLNDDAAENICAMSVTLETSHLDRSPLNDDAEANMPHMVFTLDTSHSDMSLLKEDAE